MVPKTTIFLASSAELLDDRRSFQILIAERNKTWVGRGVQLELLYWEDFIDAMSRTRLQDEYNHAVRGCDVFVMLVFTKVGQYTAEEFEVAFKQFQSTAKPVIYTYFKSAPIDIDTVPAADLASREAIKARLAALGHFHTTYKTTEALELHFWRQLEKLADSGVINFKPGPLAGDGMHAINIGSGAIAQGAGATALAAGAVLIGGANHGTVNTGTITTTVPAGWRPVGRH